MAFDIRRGGRRRGKETPCAWRVTFLGVPNLHPTLLRTACRLAGIDRHNKGKSAQLPAIYVDYRLCDDRQAWCRLHGLVLS